MGIRFQIQSTVLSGAVSWSGARCDIDNDAGNVEFFGRLYNWFSTNSSYGLCPNEWHVPTDGEWIELEVELGMSLGQAQGTYYRGTDQGDQLKSQANWNGFQFERFRSGFDWFIRGPYLGCEYSPVTSGTWFLDFNWKWIVGCWSWTFSGRDWNCQNDKLSIAQRLLGPLPQRH